MADRTATNGQALAAFGSRPADIEPPRSPRQRPWVVGVLIAIVVVRLAVAAFAIGPVRRAFGGPPYPLCGSAQMVGDAAREGLCSPGQPSDWTTYNVVDRIHTLHMPEYDARLLDVRYGRMHVTGPFDASLYPGRRGVLVSFDVQVTNTGRRSLQFGTPARGRGAPEYPRPAAPIFLGTPSAVGAESEVQFPALLRARGGPRPELFGRPPIPPGASVSGWVSVVAGLHTPPLMRVPFADVFFLRADSGEDYVGQIRLWKPPLPEQALPLYQR
jgi:hypothetical protein